MKSLPFIAAAALAFCARAGEIYSGRLYAEPAKPYANQPFELRMEIAAALGCEIEDLRVSGLPGAGGALELGQMREVSRTRAERGGKDASVFLYAVDARSAKPMSRRFAPAISCTLVQRRSAGFFSRWQAFAQQKTLDPFTLEIAALPEAGRPAGFSGAIGAFRLRGALSQSAVRPGDIVTLTVELAGTGWMGDAAVPAPAASPLFKSYPPRSEASEPLRRVATQAWIPNSTNASEIGAVRFPYFNPASGRYETASAGPFRLSFTAAAAASAAAPKVVIRADAAPAADAVSDAATVTLDDVNRSMRRFGPLIAVAAGALLAGFIFFALWGRHTLAGSILAALSLAIGAFAGRIASVRNADAGTFRLAERCDVRLAPSAQSALLFSLGPGAEATPLETASGWTRIDSGGRRGWARPVRAPAAAK